MTSNNSDFKLLAAEADNEREREMKTRVEAQLLKLEINQQNNDGDEGHEKSYNSINYTNVASNSVVSDSTFSSKYSSRTSSAEPMAVDVRVKQLEEQNKEYKLAYIQLIDEKETINYQIGLIRDQMEDLNENLRNNQRELAEKRKQCAYQKCQIDEFSNRLKYLNNQIEIRDQLILDNNLVLSDTVDFTDSNIVDNQNKEPNSNDNFSSNITGTALLPKDLVQQLKELSETSLENCIRKLLELRQTHQDDIKVLQRKLDDDKEESENWNKKDNRKKNKDSDYETLKQNFQGVKNQYQEYKRQLQISQQKVTALEADVIRLEGQVKRHKSIAESCEKQEEELKLAKRKYQREFREAQNKIEDLKSENSTLMKKLEKFTKQKIKKEGN